MTNPVEIDFKKLLISFMQRVEREESEGRRPHIFSCLENSLREQNLRWDDDDIVPFGMVPKFKEGDVIKSIIYPDMEFEIREVDYKNGVYYYTEEGCGNDIDYADENFILVEEKTDKPK